MGNVLKKSVLNNITKLAKREAEKNMKNCCAFFAFQPNPPSLLLKNYEFKKNK